MISRAAELFRNFSFPGNKKGLTLVTGFRGWGQGQLTEKEMYVEGYGINYAVFTAVSKIADKCATMPLKLWERNAKGEKMEVLDDDVLRLLHRPHPTMDYPSFVRWWVSYYLLAGNSFVMGPGFDNPVTDLPAWLFVLNPEDVQVKVDTLGLPLEYQVYFRKGNRKVFEVDEISYHSVINHTMKFNPINQDRGMSPMRPLQLSIESHNESKKFVVCFMKNRAVPSGALVSEKPLTPTQMTEFRKELQENYQSSQNAGQPLILSGGVKWQPFTGLGSKGQFHISDINDDAKAIALAMGLPPQLLGVTGDSTYNNVESAKLALVEETCIPIMQSLASSLSMWMVTPKNKNRRLWPHIDDVPEIQEKKMKIYERVDKFSSYSLNEKRTRMDVDEKEGRVYDSPLIAPNLIPADDYDLFFADSVDDEEPETLPSDDDKKSMRAQAFGSFIPFNVKASNLTKAEKRTYHADFLRLRFGLERRMKKDFTKAFIAQGKKLVAKAGDMVDQQAVDQIIEERLELDFEPFTNILNKHYRRIFKKFNTFTMRGFKNSQAVIESKDPVEVGSFFENELLQFILDVSSEQVQHITDTTRKELQAILHVGIVEGLSEIELANAIEESYEGFSEARARNIARTETTIASNSASRASAESLQIATMLKGWLNAGDGRVRDGKSDNSFKPCECKASANHVVMNDVEIPMNHKFRVPGKNGNDRMDGPGDKDAPVGQIAGCRCATYYVVPVE